MAHSYDYGDNSHGPHLYVEYTTSGGPTPTPTNTPVGPTATYTPTPTGSASGTVDVRVGSSSDDAEEYGSSVDLTSSDLEMVDDDSQSRLDQTVGLRFTNITIPQGATITTAYIEFEVDEYDSDTTSLTIQGQAADNPSTFTTSSGDITGRTTTTASVSWNNIPTWSTAGDLEQTPSLTTIVQEMVNRSGWQSGNAMAFLIEGSGKRVARSYDYSSGDAPRLYIEYTTSGGPTPTPTNTPTGPTPTPTTTPTGSSCTVTLTPVADAFVRSGSYASTNYGSDTQLVVKAGGTNYKRETHFKFDLSSLGISSITDADLEVDVTYVKNGGPVPVTVYASGSDSWTEGGITWNNRPSLGTSQTTVSISSTGIASFDVTSLTSTEAAGDETLSLILWDNNSTDLEVEMRSKEDGTNAPELVVSGWCSSASAGNQQLASVDSGLQILWRNTISEFRDYMTVAQALTSQEVSVIGPQPKPQSRSKVASQTTVTQSTVRKTYLLAGQAIAQKTVVTVGSNPSTSELYFIYTDHLGSANVLATADGNNTPVQVARFMPFGEYRTEPTADITDRGFTGHRENREIGLTYMNARFYISSIGRFASADTIVPDPASPQSYNRYTHTHTEQPP